jgi:Mce-associated membrane protein
MATKIFKRTNAKDIFDRLADQDQVPDSKTAAEDLDKDDEITKSDTEEPAADENGRTADADEADDADDADDADEETPSSSRRRRWLNRLLAAAAGFLFIAALGSSGFLGWQLKEQHDTTAAGSAALAAAQSYAVTLTSIDPSSIDQNFNEVLDGATGEFKDMYNQSASQLRQVLIDNKATSNGVVVDSAIKSATTTKVEVLLFIDQTISNTANPEPRIDRSRVAMTMELVDKRWLVSKVDIK